MIGGIGEGLFALIFLFAILLLTCLIGCNLDNGYFVYVPVFCIVLLITLILVLAPKVPRSMLDAQREAEARKTFDNQAVAQAAIVATVSCGAVGGLLVFFFSHCIVAVNARSLDD